MALKMDIENQKWPKIKSFISYYWQDLQKGTHSS